MAEQETLREPIEQDKASSPADLLVALPVPLGSKLLPATIAKLTQACRLLSTPCNPVLALPAEAASEKPALMELAGATPSAPALHFVHYQRPASEPGAIPWLAHTQVYRDLSSLAQKLGVRACTILGTDPGIHRESLTAQNLTLLLDPAIEGSFDLVMPLYNAQAFDDLVNKSILYPLSRALYGHQVHNPLGSEFQMSSKLFRSLSADAPKNSAHQPGRLLWLATLAASRNLRICQVQLGTWRPPGSDGIELSDALAQLAGSLFLDMEDHAAFWQRIRGSHPVPTFGDSESAAHTGDPVDVRHMLEAFQLGERNLREIWSLILPPITLLELAKLSRLPADQFHMEDALWARIVYDFALAHRLRNIHRAHLFGALTPLYLGWAASYATEINRNGIATAPDRVEQLARVFESEKPYLLSRWRWPDRFHP